MLHNYAHAIAHVQLRVYFLYCKIERILRINTGERSCLRRLREHTAMSNGSHSPMKQSRDAGGHDGHISIFIGSMFSGKTTSMTMCVERYARAGKRCCIVSTPCDNRFDLSSGMKNHRGHVFDGLDLHHCASLADIDLSSYDVVGVDEGQFFPDIVATSDSLSNNGKIVVIAYLDSNFERKPFGPIGELIARAEYCEKLSAVCKCGKDGSFNKRLGDGKEEVQVGTDYAALCRRCFQK